MMEGTYIPAAYMAVRRNGQTGDIIRVEYGSDIDSVLKKAGVGSLDGIRAIALGNTLYLPDAARGIVISPDTPIGNGVISLYPGACCMVHEADENLAAYIKISCGKCTFCREGLIQLKSNTEDIISGNARKGCVALMEEIGEAMTFSSQCTLGRAAPEFMLGTLKLFGSEYDEHIRKKKCAKNVCYSLSTIYIDPNECRGCEECLDICPAEAIEGKKGFIHMIDEYECIKCGKCIEACEYKAIILTNGRVPKLPERLTKVGKFRKH